MTEKLEPCNGHGYNGPGLAVSRTAMAELASKSCLTNARGTRWLANARSILPTYISNGC